MIRILVPTAGLLVLCAGPASAQFNQKWASFVPAPDALPSGPTLSDDEHETDLDWADLDLDGDTDLVVVRKKPWTNLGKRSNVLLRNEGGVLVDRTASHAAAADVAGDQGFLTWTNDRDVVLADLTGDGYPEAVTATDRTNGEPKHVSHPRVYRNLGAGAGGWDGLRFEDGRVPLLLHFVTGLPEPPMFPAVDAGDLDDDGDLDLYFGDHDTLPNLFAGVQHPLEDLNDRLLLNDGTGFFTDASTTALTPDMGKSGFCNSVRLVDVNDDGVVDVVKQATYQPNETVSIAYNDPLAPGTFAAFFEEATPAPYFVDAGDLNNDGRVDLAITSNSDDHVLVNQGNGPGGAAVWSTPKTLQLLTGSEPVGFFGLTYSSNNRVVDLDGDGWAELLVADVDAEITEYADGFRLHLYHNRGGAFPGDAFELVEERGSPSDASWVGAHGLLPTDLRWTHDTAVFDVDGDGLQDLVLSRREGTQVWRQAPPPLCQPDLGAGGELVLEVCGGDLSAGQDAVLSVFNGTPLDALFLAVGDVAAPLPLPDLGVTLVPGGALQVLTFATDAAGGLALPVPGGSGPSTRVVQAFQLGPALLPLLASNAVEVAFLP